MKVLICEDNHYWIETIQSLISKWSIQRLVKCELFCLSSPHKVIDYLKHNDVDVLILDISFGGKKLDGMKLAKYLRLKGHNVPIIFITENIIRAIDGYLVEAIGFLSKPIEERRLSLFLDRIIKNKQINRTIKIMTNGHITSILQQDILYVEVNDHIVTFHTKQNRFQCRGTLSKIVNSLDKDCFVQIHRSYVIALDKIESIKTTYPYAVNLLNKNDIINLPVSRKYIAKLLELYSDNVLEKLE